MGIRIKNHQQEVYVLKCYGTLSVTTTRDVQPILFPGAITNVVAVMAAGGATTATVIDLNKNGTTVFAAATKVTLSAATPSVATYSGLTTTPYPVAAGDILSVDVDSCPTTASNAIVVVTVTRNGLGPATNTLDHDDVI